MALWGGRFEGGVEASTQSFGASLPVDRHLYRQDIAGSRAPAAMLAKQGIISFEDFEAIDAGLCEIEGEIDAGTFVFNIVVEDIHMAIEGELTRRIGEAGKRLHTGRAGLCEIEGEIDAGTFVFNIVVEDIHMAIEGELTRRIGEAGKRLHTGRSRNDQVATDTRLAVKAIAKQLMEANLNLRRALVDTANEHMGVVLPGMTHLQHAQPVLLSHHLLAYYWMFTRDFKRIDAAFDAADASPLGAAALAGTTYPLDRVSCAYAMGFTSVVPNSLDAVSDRDFLVDLHVAWARRRWRARRTRSTASHALTRWASRASCRTRSTRCPTATSSSICTWRARPWPCTVRELRRRSSGGAARSSGTSPCRMRIPRAPPSCPRRRTPISPSSYGARRAACTATSCPEEEPRFRRAHTGQDGPRVRQPHAAPRDVQGAAARVQQGPPGGQGGGARLRQDPAPGPWGHGGDGLHDGGARRPDARGVRCRASGRDRCGRLPRQEGHAVP